MAKQQIPAKETRAEIRILNSRFIATIAPAFTVDEAYEIIRRIKEEFADASHNVPAFVIGHGSSTIAHCSDDGEPAGTAGRPALAVLKGSGLGDVVVVVTRYFGGTKLGTGGLVRAYGDAVKEVLKVASRAEKVSTHTVKVALPYNLYEQTRKLIEQYDGLVLNETFAADVNLTVQFRISRFPGFQEALKELSHGALDAQVIETSSDTIMPI